MTTSAAREAVEAVHGDEARIARARRRSDRRPDASWLDAFDRRVRPLHVGEDLVGALREQLVRHRRPTAAASVAEPARFARTARAPSSESTTAASVIESPVTVACAPIGIWQPPPSSATTARSASSASARRRIVDRCDRGRRRASSLARISTAMMPWPGAGTHVVGGQTRRDARALLEADAVPRRRARARRTRPHRACAGACRGCRESGRNVRAGNSRASCADPPDAARADARCAAEPRRQFLESRRLASEPFGRRRAGPRASRGSSRGSTAAMRKSVGQNGRHVLAAVDGQIDLAGEQRVLDFLDEQPLAADLRQRRVGEPVARRLDDDDLAVRRRSSRAAARRQRRPETARARCRVSRGAACHDQRCPIGGSDVDRRGPSARPSRRAAGTAG